MNGASLQVDISNLFPIPTTRVYTKVNTSNTTLETKASRTGSGYITVIWRIGSTNNNICRLTVDGTQIFDSNTNNIVDSNNPFINIGTYYYSTSYDVSGRAWSGDDLIMAIVDQQIT